MPYKLRKAVNHKFKKKNYNQRDWKTYEAGLRNRGNITIWFSEEAIAAWHPSNSKNKKRGRPKKYSDLAIETAHTLRLVYTNPLRQTEGFMNSIVDLMGLKLDIPDHTTLSRRSKTIQISKIHPASKNSVVIIDSTGLKVLGETEWMNYKHGTRQRKIWRKLHIAVNGNGNILSSRLTTHRASDSSAVNQILQPIQSPIFEVIADGGYDAKATYTALNSHQDLPIRAIIPPNTGFKAPSENDDEQRLYNIGVIADKGKYHWQNDTNYGRRSIVENTFHRYKSTFGNKLKSRNIQSQKTETQLAINILNKMVELGVSNAKISK